MAAGSRTDALAAIDSLVSDRLPGFVCVTNVHMLMESHNNPRLRRALDRSILNVADGMPLVYCIRWLKKIYCERIAGREILDHYCRRAALRECKILFMGGHPHQIQRVKIGYKISDEFFDYMILPHYVDDSIIDIPSGAYRLIEKFDPDIIFVVLGCPKQEVFMERANDAFGRPCVGVGAALAYLAGDISPPPMIIQKLCFEWLYRLLKDPNRLFIRYMKTNFQFLRRLAMGRI